MLDHIHMLNQCCQMACDMLAKQHHPAAAIMTLNGKVLSHSNMRPPHPHAPTDHACIRAIQEAARIIDNTHLIDCCLYTAMEPCLMCYQAAKAARIKTIYYAYPDKAFGVFTQHHHLALTNSHSHNILGLGPFLQCRPTPNHPAYCKDKL